MSPTQPSRRRMLWVIIATAAITSLLTGVTTAYASDRFGDVPNSSPFHDDISWLADTGITTGFNDGSFRPGSPVTRQAMAAFLRRLYDLRAQAGMVQSANLSTTTSTSWTDIPSASTTVFVPAGTNAQIVATFAGDANCFGPVNGVFCSVRILLDGVEMAPIVGSDNSFASTTSGWGSRSLNRGEILLSGTYTLKAQYRVGSGASFSVDNWLLSADIDGAISGP